MERKQIDKVLGCISIALLAMSLAACVGSRAMVSGQTLTMQADDVLRAAVGDSVAAIVLHADKVEITCEDSLTRELTADEATIARYVMGNKVDYESDNPVYGMFYNYFEVTFTRGIHTVTAQYDFRLRKWMLVGKGNKQLGRYDLRTDDMLRVAARAYPQNKRLSTILEQERR